MSKHLGRRRFLALTASAMPLFYVGAEGFGRSRAKRIAEGAKIRLGLIGCGSRMGHSTGYGIVNGMLKDCEVVCIAEPDPKNRTKVLNLIRKYGTQNEIDGKAVFPDYREMFAKFGDKLDAVAIATPNHHHALPAIMAMRLGLHVYVEKPMALTVHEVALMLEEARRSGVVMQVGNHGHSEEGMRRLVEYIRAGTIGQIRDVWSFDDRINAMRVRPPKATPPAGMDWDSWCGPAPVCDYYAPANGHQGMHPHDWHNWIGYGNGSIGNMGTHIIDPVFWALDLKHPESVIANRAEWGCKGSWTWSTEIEWRFPARHGMDPVTLHWFDGIKPNIPFDSKHVNAIGICRDRSYQHLPPILEELEKKYGQSLGALGTVFVGEKGIIRIGAHGDGLVFGPKDLYKKRPPKLFKREKGLTHQADWIRAIRNPERPCGCNAEYSAPLATTVLLGNAAPRAGKGRKLLWDGRRFTNAPDADAYLRTTYRKGWEIV